MKFKEKQEEKSGMSKELYDMFIDIIQTEYEKMSFVLSAKFYFYHEGCKNYKKFFSKMLENCGKCKFDFEAFLVNHMESVPEFNVPAIDLDFNDITEPFDKFVDYEEEFVEKLNNLAKKALEVADTEVLAFVLPMIKNIDHIACRAAECVKNQQNPLDLICDEGDVSRKTSSK